MDYAVILSPTSLANLKEITFGLAADDPLVAELIGNKLLDRIAILQTFPMAGSVYVAEKKWRKLISGLMSSVTALTRSGVWSKF